MSTEDLETDEVAAIYDELLKTYKTEWEYRGHRSLHLAYYDEDHDDPGAAAMNTMRVLSEAANVDGTDRILNIGCGAGEDSVWNARAYGAEVVGVNISERQLELARENAREHDVEELTDFRYDDFQTLETVENDSFDLVWGLEALSHSPDREAALQTATRVLMANGRVAFTDLFLTENADELSPSEREQIETIEDALGLRLGSIEEFEQTLERCSFREITVRALTEGIKQCTRRRHSFARIGYPVGRVLQRVGIVSSTQVDGLKASSLIHKLIESDVLGYYLVTAELSGDESDSA